MHYFSPNTSACPFVSLFLELGCKNPLQVTKAWSDIVKFLDLSKQFVSHPTS